MTHRLARTALGSAAALALLALATGCSSDTKHSSTTVAGAPAPGDATTLPAADPGDTGTLEVPGDVCALFDNAAVSALLGEGVVGEATPSGGCKFNGTTSASLYPVVEITLADPMGGLAGWQSTNESLLGATAQAITVAGFPGFVVNGAMQTIAVGMGATAVQGLLITINVSSADAAKNTAAISGLLEMAASAL